MIVVNEFEFYEMKVNEDGTTSPTILCSFNKMQTLQLETFLSQIERVLNDCVNPSIFKYHNNC